MAVKLTVTVPLPVAPIVGVANGESVVIDAEVADVEVVPLPVGTTVKVYAVALAKPVTVQLCAPVGGVVVFATTQLKPPGEEVTV